MKVTKFFQEDTDTISDEMLSDMKYFVDAVDSILARIGLKLLPGVLDAQKVTEGLEVTWTNGSLDNSTDATNFLEALNVFVSNSHKKASTTN